MTTPEQDWANLPNECKKKMIQIKIKDKNHIGKALALL